MTFPFTHSLYSLPFSLSLYSFPSLFPFTPFPLLLSLYSSLFPFPFSFPLLLSLYSFPLLFPFTLSLYSFPFPRTTQKLKKNRFQKGGDFNTKKCSFYKVRRQILTLRLFWAPRLIRMSFNSFVYLPKTKIWTLIHSYVFQFIRMSSPKKKSEPQFIRMSAPKKQFIRMSSNSFVCLPIPNTLILNMYSNFKTLIPQYYINIYSKIENVQGPKRRWFQY